jgi:hypothetical protein
MASSPFRPSTTEPEVAAAPGRFTARLLRIEAGVEEILTVAERFPDQPTRELAWLAALPRWQAREFDAAARDGMPPRAPRRSARAVSPLAPRGCAR